MRVAIAIVRAAAVLVPADRRREWLREWEAEIHGAFQRRDRPAGRLGMRCLGAFAHAAWLRWDQWRFEMLGQDLRYAIRTLIRRPGFVTVAVLTLAVGIGANAAIFGALRAVLLRPLPFPEPDQLVQIFSTTTAQPDRLGGTASPPDFVDWRAQSTSFAEMAALNAGSIPWSGHGPAEQVPHAMVTGGFFRVLASPPLHGRVLGEEDAAPGADVVVLSYDLWVRRFGSDPAVVGRTMTLDSTPRRIVGVMPAGISYPLGSELWVPLRFTPDALATQRGGHYLDVIARLKPGVTLHQAQSEMSTIVARLADAYPQTNADKATAVFSLREALVGDAKPALFVLTGAVAFVLLIVCVNIASLTLTRAAGRTRELAVRAALGAGRTRLMNGLVAEGLVLAAAGGAAGLLVAVWASQGIASLDPGIGIPLLDETRVDHAVVAFTLGLSLLAAVLSGALPAWHAASGLDVSQRIRQDAGTLTASRERQRLRASLILAETALAVMLLVGAGLLMRTFLEMSAVDLGFNPSRVQTFSVTLPEATYATPQARAEFVSTLVTRLASRPDVESAGAVFGLPLSGFGYTITTSTLDGRRLTDEEQDQRSVQVRVVTPDYFGALGIPLLRGRPFAEHDRLGRPRVAIVNESAARLLWPDQDALGRHFELGTRLSQGGERAGGEVIAVLRDVREYGPARPVRPTAYFAHAQFPIDFFSVVVKARRDAASVIEPSRALVSDLDPDLPVFRVRSMEQFVANAVAQPRLYVTLIGLFAAAALLLAALGIYGVLAHGVAQRTREIGIRLALGARRGEVVGLVVRQAAVVTLGGLFLGLALALGASRLIEGLLFGVEPTDPLTYAAVALVLFGIAVIASYLPARRATRVDPFTALHHD